MSLDNVIAIAASAEIAAAQVDLAHAAAIKATLIIFGLATSVPLIVAGSAHADGAAGALPVLVWARRRAARLGRGRHHGQGRRASGELALAPALVETVAHLGRRPSAPSSWSRSVWIIRRMHAQARSRGALIVDPPGPDEIPSPPH